MKILSLVGAFLATAAMTWPNQPASPILSALPCTIPGGSRSAATIQSIKIQLASSDSDAVRWRTSFGFLGVDSSSVSVVTDSLTCSRITATVDSEFQSAPSTTALAALSAGPRFIAFDTATQVQLYVLDSAFALKHVIIP